MNQKQMNDKWLDYMNGTISRQEWEAFKTTVPEGPETEELEALEKIWLAMDQLPEAPEPSQKLHERFYATLGDFRKKEAKAEGQSMVDWITEAFSWRRLAIGMAIFIIGGSLGYMLSPSMGYKQEISELSGEMRDMKQMMMLTLLERPAAQDRLRAVSLSTELPEADSRIIDALVQTLNTDENVNVRLVTVEALARFGRYPEVREALVNSIAIQTSPLVQVALADTMVALNEKGAVEALRGLLKNENLNETVRERVQQSIEVLI